MMCVEAGGMSLQEHVEGTYWVFLQAGEALNHSSVSEVARSIMGPRRRSVPMRGEYTARS